MIVKMGSSSPSRGENKKSLKPPVYRQLVGFPVFRGKVDGNGNSNLFEKGLREFHQHVWILRTMYVGLEESHEKSGQITIVPRP